MKKPRSEKKEAPSRVAATGPVRTKRSRLLERWRRLATGLRGVRLFHVTVAVGGVFWEAECRLNGKWVCRRFASELHARAWLSVATQSSVSLSSVEQKEVERPCSSSCFATGG
jgi:hypothetical protein